MATGRSGLPSYYLTTVGGCDPIPTEFFEDISMESFHELYSWNSIDDLSKAAREQAARLGELGLQDTLEWLIK